MVWPSTQTGGDFGFATGSDYVTGGPGWVATDRFDVQAKLDPQDIPQFRDLTMTQRLAMLQRLLADRFKLAAHREKHEEQGYALEIAPGGPKVRPATEPGNSPDRVKGTECIAGGRGSGNGDLHFQNCTMDAITQGLKYIVKPGLVDKSGLTGRYDFDLRWNYERKIRSGQLLETNPEYPDLFTAIKQQLGMRLVTSEIAVDAIVIDHAEKPTGN